MPRCRLAHSTNSCTTRRLCAIQSQRLPVLTAHQRLKALIIASNLPLSSSAVYSHEMMIFRQLHLHCSINISVTLSPSSLVRVTVKVVITCVTVINNKRPLQSRQCGSIFSDPTRPNPTRQLSDPTQPNPRVDPTHGQLWTPVTVMYKKTFVNHQSSSSHQHHHNSSARLLVSGPSLIIWFPAVLFDAE